MASLIFAGLMHVGVSGAIASAIGSLGSALLISRISARLAGRQRGPNIDMRQGLPMPTSSPQYRYAYGRARIPGTPCPGWVVDGQYRYVCLLLNSRPSAGGDVRIFIDKREVELSGDIFDFETGAIATNAPFVDHAQFWMGRGNQTTLPKVIRDSSAYDASSTDARKLWPTDLGQGFTVLWCRLRNGAASERQERWPSPVNLDIEVEADWSLVWDPRDPAQDSHDTSTWHWSENHGLCTLDAIRFNPVAPRSLRHCWVESLVEQAERSDAPRALLGDLSEPSWRVGGLMIFSEEEELYQQLAPMADAGGGYLTQAMGRLGYASLAPSDPVITITKALEPQIKFRRTQPRLSLPKAIRASYPDPLSEWELSTLQALPITEEALGESESRFETPVFSMVPFATQVMHLQQIAQRRHQHQKELEFIAPPSALRAVGGSIVKVEFPRAEDQRNGLYQVQKIDPARWLAEDDKVALQMPLVLREYDPSISAWNPATDQQPVVPSNFVPINLAISPPGALSLTTGPGVALGAVPRIRFEFSPSAGRVQYYDWVWRQVGDDFQAGGSIPADLVTGAGLVFGHLSGVAPGEDYEISVSADWFGARSEPVTATITALGPDFELDPPSDGQATGGAGQIEVSFLTPNNTAFEAIEFWGSDTDDAGAATLLAAPIASAANTVRTIIEDELGDDVTRFYFARSRGPFGSVSGFSASVSATTDP